MSLRERVNKLTRRIIGTHATQKRRILSLASISILVTIAVFYSLFSHAYDSQFRKLRQTVHAQLFTAELLEFFRAMNAAALARYHKSYPLCAHINLLDRKSNKVLNPDPTADMGHTHLDFGREASRANRFYQVQVINLTSLAVNPKRCTTSPDLPLKPEEAFLVTVGLSWRPNPSQPQQVASVTSSTVVLP